MNVKELDLQDVIAEIRVKYPQHKNRSSDVIRELFDDEVNDPYWDEDSTFDGFVECIADRLDFLYG